ncbi:unnamed protein product [Moneuplotes crassus]|uniref:Uncharacterized protein n=1 Tax=Euplotes crassus TaxID=5936 RepID=A0AAD1X7F6_EUPCR|nr:unnamed protein product [Moneuplotes crassus]
MLPGYLKRDNVFIQQNEAELQDGYFSYQPGGDQRGFIGVERVDSRLSVQQDSLSTEIYRMQFVKDAQSKFYERRVFSLLEVTGNIGGLFEILEKTGAILVSLFSGKVFIFSILSKLYHVEESEGRYTNKISPFETEIKSKELAKCNYKNRISMHEIRNYTAQSLRSRDLFVNKAQKIMKRRLRYNWKISDFVYNFFHPLSTLLCFCCMRKNRLNAQKRMKLYSRGETKFINEFDAVQYAKSMRSLNTLISSLMDDKERFMIRYQKSNCISSSNKEEDPKDDTSNDVPSIFCGSKKQFHSQVIDNFMNEYKKEEWTDKDYRLLNGVLTNEHLTNQQLEELMDDREATNIYTDNDLVDISNVIPPKLARGEEAKFERVSSLSQVFHDS